MKKVSLLSFTGMLLLATLASAQAARPGFGELWYEGFIVRTVVPPASKPGEGRDNFYAVPDQRAVVAVAPGDMDYHGGDWAFHSVIWTVDPYPLSSEQEVLEAANVGDVMIMRLPASDFLCPVQP